MNAHLFLLLYVVPIATIILHERTPAIILCSSAFTGK